MFDESWLPQGLSSFHPWHISLSLSRSLSHFLPLPFSLCLFNSVWIKNEVTFLRFSANACVRCQAKSGLHDQLFSLQGHVVLINLSIIHSPSSVFVHADTIAICFALIMPLSCPHGYFMMPFHAMPFSYLAFIHSFIHSFTHSFSLPTLYLPALISPNLFALNSQWGPGRKLKRACGGIRPVSRVTDNSIRKCLNSRL